MHGLDLDQSSNAIIKNIEYLLWFSWALQCTLNLKFCYTIFSETLLAQVRSRMVTSSILQYNQAAFISETMPV